MQTIDGGILKRSALTFGSAESRTSQTCHLSIEDEDGITARVERKLQSMMGPSHNPACAEALQGQRYKVGDYFHSHTYWFTPNTEEYETHCQVGGQRTWTVMIYLNNVEKGGETKFESILREFIPREGTALAWNNLDANGTTPNPWSLHAAMPIVKGTKYVLTKWFRERPLVM
jgi:prolyl 4-hydroxylase